MGLYEQHYFFELSRRDSLNSSLAFPVGLVTLIASAIAFMAPLVGKVESGLEWTLCSFLLVGAVCLLVSAFYLVRAYWGYTYKFMPHLDELHAYKHNLFQFFQKSGNPDDTAMAMSENKFSADLDAEYARNCAINAKNNDSKSSNIFLANCFIIAAIVMAIFAGPAYGILTFSAPESAHPIRIVNPQELRMPTHEQKPQPIPAPTTKPAPQPVMPTMPPSRDIREHVDPGKAR